MRRASPSDTDARNAVPKPRQLVATWIASFLGGDAGRIVEPAVSRFFGGGLLGTEHQSLETGLGIGNYTGAARVLSPERGSRGEGGLGRVGSGRDKVPSTL